MIDWDRFRSTSGLKLDRYVEEFYRQGFPKGAEQFVRTAIDQWNQLDCEHKLYVVTWTCMIKDDSAFALAMRFLQEEDAPMGAQAAILSALYHLRPLSSRMLRQIERIPNRLSDEDLRHFIELLKEEPNSN